MRIVELGRQDWQTVAVCEEDGVSPLLRSLDEGTGGDEVCLKAFAHLEETWPKRGPPYRNKEQCRQIKGTSDLWEMKVRGKGGASLRLIWFRDRKRLVFTNLFTKGKRIPPSAINLAHTLKAAYEASHDQIEVVKFPEYARQKSERHNGRQEHT